MSTKQVVIRADGARLVGIVDLELRRGGRVIHRQRIKNTVVTVGKNSNLDVCFRNQSQLANWYIGLIDNSGFTAIAAADTMASHAGWNEFTNYDESTRVEWAPDAAASGSITNGTARTFNISGSGTLKGIFVTSGSAKSGSAGTLWAATAFAATITVSNGDDLKVTYTVSIS